MTSAPLHLITMRMKQHGLLAASLQNIAVFIVEKYQFDALSLIKRPIAGLIFKTIGPIVGGPYTQVI
ncbi:hypothetical protein CBP31_05660 [Oceanisphaera profunda]|uniref:Uncharacterized protein n=1 Tax=Oceanisphaera profunda TaxID=1416627 RepID=A0A1Y0D4R2_9GAMM|nr:hypothetical protein CBP31_05660 [Oceanisphaera profunda]